ncbi:MAG: DUF86 domain-containing protein [Nanoarchaeota archaeon]|nr:DUF86 domain-containing protein [Nanoarchaeota archaeon]
MLKAKQSTKERIKKKIKELENYLKELIEFMPYNFEDYIHDFKIKAACERYFEKIIEASIDLTFLIIKDRKFKIPEDDREAFDILAKEGVINDELADRLKDAKGMRNIIAHQYGNVDDKVVFISITKELVNDVNKFLNNIKSSK